VEKLAGKVKSRSQCPFRLLRDFAAIRKSACRFEPHFDFCVKLWV
jgi:hypothetical protein